MLKSDRFFEEEDEFEEEEDIGEEERGGAEEKREKTREDAIPKASHVVIKDIVKRPVVVCSILYLHKHGVASQADLAEAIGVNTVTLLGALRRLVQMKIIDVIRQKDKENVMDRRMTYYSLPQDFPELPRFISELERWYEYEILRKLERTLPTREWLEVESLEKNEMFEKILSNYRVSFEKALSILLNSGWFYTKTEERSKKVVAIKRKYDGYGRKMVEEEEKVKWTDFVEQ